MYENEKWKSTFDILSMNISDDSKVQGISKNTKILTSLDGLNDYLKYLYRSPLNKESKERSAVSITNIAENPSFLNYQLSVDPIDISRLSDYHQTIKFIFNKGELICTPYTKLITSDGDVVFAKDVKSYTALLGFDVVKGKINIVSKYVKSVKEHSFVDRVFDVSNQTGNIALALTDRSGIFISVEKID